MLTPRTTRLQLDGNAAWTTPPFTPRRLLVCDAAGRTTLRTATEIEREWTEPTDALEWMAQSVRVEPPGSRWVGYLSYDFGRQFELAPVEGALPAATGGGGQCPPYIDLALPLFAFGFGQPIVGPSSDSPPPIAAAHVPTSNFTRFAYESAVARAIDYIRAGDVFQVNLSQRFSAPLHDPPADVYARLRAAAPGPYGAFLDFGDFALLSHSPELFLRVTPDRRVITQPIKGTRPRQPGMEAELRESVKDAAELNMIVDLERNDLGRVCEIGSVRVTQPRAIENHPTVYHGVATVEGQLRPDVTFTGLLRATFPGGSITGAPKIRAMQIIDALEPTPRGPYCGAIGYLAPDGTVELNIAIRTIVTHGAQAHVHVGGGIVADSKPAAEYDETLVKARGMFAALGVSI